MLLHRRPAVFLPKPHWSQHYEDPLQSPNKKGRLDPMRWRLWHLHSPAGSYGLLGHTFLRDDGGSLAVDGLALLPLHTLLAA